MNQLACRRGRMGLVGWVFWAGGSLALVSPPVALALAPESAEVKQLVAKGITFLEQPPQEVSSDTYSRMPGAKALVGLVMLKDGRGANHPQVQEAVQAIRPAALASPITLDVYNEGLALIFLIELDPQQYRPEIDAMLNHLLAVQKPHGGWGYRERTTGDTSMTQYGVLSMWAAEQAGIPVPLEHWERVTNWLLRTQDPSGGFGYQATDPGGFQLVSQTNIRNSTSTAALGSLYICADFLGLVNPKPDQDDGLPAALKRVKKNGPERGRKTANVEVEIVNQVKARGEQWQRANYTINAREWLHYYLYALERYQSFRELSQGPAPGWYDDGVKLLADTQRKDGSWVSAPGNHIVSDTAFALLFLLRSTQKSINKTYGDGRLAGGRGLPAEGDVELRLGKVKARPLAGPAEELLAKVGDPNDPKFQAALAGLNKLAAEGDEEVLSAHAERLRELSRGKSPEARAAALGALARTRNLDEVPLLIEALKDPDPLVFRAAYDGLRFISRKFAGVGQTGGGDEASRATAAAQLKAWYRSIRPAADLED